MTTVLTTEIQSELHSIAERCGCELIHMDFAGGLLRLVLDGPEGVTIEHCESVSREASAMLDVCDFGSGHYTLEVSSPGLDRELYRIEDYERFSGSRARVTWTDPETRRQRTDAGVMTFEGSSEEPSIRLEIGESSTTIQISDISKARLDPEF